MIRLILGLYLVFFAELAAAQVAAVRSGAHEGFDRLVIDMPTRMNWSSEQRESGVSVIFENRALSFDLDDVFDRIGRTRLRAISAPGRGGRIDLDFACPCRLRAFWHGASMLVLDIVDEETVSASSADRNEEDAFAPTAGLPVTRATDNRLSPAGATLKQNLRNSLGPRQAKISDGGSPRGQVPDLGIMSETLRRQLGRAASQGLVTLSTIPVRGSPDWRTPTPDAKRDGESIEGQDRDASSMRPKVGSPVTATPELRATTSMDRDMDTQARSVEEHATSKRCPPEELVDVRSWGTNQSFMSEIGRLNRSLFGEFDQLDNDVALELARLYIHHGLGAEARQVLGFLAPTKPEVIMAQELADLVEHETRPKGILATASRCGEPAVLWALLAKSDLPEEIVFDHRALKRSFAALSETLRRSLGPVLVRRLASAGHDQTAKAVFGLIGGDKDRAGMESRFAKAALADGSDAQREAEADLKDVVRSNAPQSGMALAERLEAALRRGQPISLADSQLAGALAFEHRGTPLGNRLTAVYLEALGASGAFDKAVSEFDRLRPELHDATGAEVAAKMVAQLLSAADDVTFLRHIVTDRLAASTALPKPLTLAVAERLLALGFAEDALRYVESIESRDNARDVRLLRARIALALGSAAKADLELIGLEGRDADLLRAEALQALGDHSAAQRLFEAHEYANGADRAALRNGQPDALIRAEEPVLREIADVIGGNQSAAPRDDTDGNEEDRMLLEQSGNLRDAVRRLLADTAISTSTN